MCIVFTAIIVLADDIRALATSVMTVKTALLALFFIGSYVFSVHWTALAIIFWSTVALPLAFIYSLTVLLFVTEYTVRRLAEWPKGPLLASSVIIATIATIAKQFI
jgi:hypothetical protein